jgi:hypothetical protein
MKNKIVGILICLLFIISGTSIAASVENNPLYASSNPQIENDVYDVSELDSTLKVAMPKALPGGNGFLLRLRNQIRDMLGDCQGCSNLTELTGILIYTNSNFYIDVVELHFGPRWYITSAMSAVDYDGDSQLELIIDELLGLVNTTVTVEGHYQSDNWMSVFTINGETYREPGQPIWASQHEWRWRYGHGNGGQP